jgi:hypothetical protein
MGENFDCPPHVARCSLVCWSMCKQVFSTPVEHDCEVRVAKSS